LRGIPRLTAGRDMNERLRRQFDNMRARALGSCTPWGFVAARIRNLGEFHRGNTGSPSDDDVEHFLNDREGDYRKEYNSNGCAKKHGKA